MDSQLNASAQLESPPRDCQWAVRCGGKGFHGTVCAVRAHQGARVGAVSMRRLGLESGMWRTGACGSGWGGKGAGR